MRITAVMAALLVGLALVAALAWNAAEAHYQGCVEAAQAFPPDGMSIAQQYRAERRGEDPARRGCLQARTGLLAAAVTPLNPDEHPMTTPQLRALAQIVVVISLACLDLLAAVDVRPSRARRDVPGRHARQGRLRLPPTPPAIRAASTARALTRSASPRRTGPGPVARVASLRPRKPRAPPPRE